MLTCPNCDGRKSVEALVDYGGKDRHKSGPQTLPCPTCKGEGVITEEYKRRMDDGRALRDDRVARGVSQKQEAERLCIDPRALNDLERGR